MLSPRRKTALIAGGIFLVLGGLAIHASPLSSGAMQARLQSAADDALYAMRADEWARVEVNGQVATLSGLAPSRAARSAALDAVSSASWAGGVVAGGITKVVDQTRLPGEADVFALRADLSGGGMRLSGLIPDTETGDRLRMLARQNVSGRIETAFRLAPGGAPEGWELAAVQMIEALSQLDAGAGLTTRDSVVVTGLAPGVEDAAVIRSVFETPLSGFNAAALVRSDGEGFQTRLDDPVLCEMLIRIALGPRPIGFAPGRSSLTGDARAALRRAGEVYAACDAAGDLMISVRADEAGDEGAALALMRGESAAQAMAEGGVDRSRFLAEAAPISAPEAMKFMLAPVRAAPMNTVDQDEEQG